MFGAKYFGARYFGARYFGKVGAEIILVCDDISRVIAIDTQTEIAIDFTRPVFLVRMDFPTASQFMSTGPQITLDSNVYVEGQVSVSTFTWSADGVQRGAISIHNEQNAAAALILNEGVNDIPISIYLTYMIAGGSENSTPELLVAGVMNGGNLTPEKLVISVLSTKSAAQFIPNRYYSSAEAFNHLPVDGSVITWGNEKFTLQADRGS